MLAKIGALNPARPDEAFLCADNFILPGEDVAKEFEAAFGIPLPSFDKQVQPLPGRYIALGS